MLGVGEWYEFCQRRTDSEALILPADEDGRYQVATHEEQEEAIMELWVAGGIEDGEEDQSRGSSNSEDDG